MNIGVRILTSHVEMLNYCGEISLNNCATISAKNCEIYLKNVSKKYAIQFNHERNILGYHCDVVTFSANTPLFYKDCTFCHKRSGRHIYTISDLHFI